MMRVVLFSIALALVVAKAGVAPALRAQEGPSVWDGVYSEAQAKRGALVYDRECAQCHGAGGTGGSMAPPLAGGAFAANYDGQTLADLFDRNRKTMPVGREGKLSLEDNADVTAYMLQCNDFPSGQKELPVEAMKLRQIRFLAQKP